MKAIRVAVLTVSDTASADPSADKSGPTIRQILSEQGFSIQGSSAIVPDDEHRIRAMIRDWCLTGEVDLIITTGGTGFGVRDKTPEAISSLIERHAPGIVHLLISASMKHTPLAALSRPVAGTIHNTLVITLPGSVKAVKENLEALLTGGIVQHAVDLIRGGSGKMVHAALAKSSNSIGQRNTSNHHHHHHHHHEHKAPVPRTVLSHDPNLPASTRHRISPFPLISFESAMEIVLSEVPQLEIVYLAVTPKLKGCILAEDVFSAHDVPNTKTTSVDGYALRSSDPPGIYKVHTFKTHKIVDTLPIGYVYRINTGGPLPAGTDTVIMVEDTRLISTHQNEESEEREIETLAQVPEGENVRAPGSDVQRGDAVLERGYLISSSGGELGTLAFIGRKEVHVHRKPVVALLSTGNELVDLQNPVAHRGDDWGGIYDTNRPSLHAALEGMGYEVLDLGIVTDDIASHVSAFTRGLKEADIIISTGGTSMGPTDLLKPVIERHLNGKIHFGRVTVKPGKPTTFATVPVDGVFKPVFGLPGNPASALVTFYIFVVPALRKLGGWPIGKCQLPRVRVQLQSPMPLDSRTEFHRVTVSAGPAGLSATSTGGQRSSRVASLSGANGLFVLHPKSDGGPTKLEVGEFGEAVIISEIVMGQ